MRKIVLLLLPLFSFACFRNEKTLGTKDNPVVVALSAAYFQKLSDSDLSYFQSYLNLKAGFFVKVETYKESASLIKDIGSGKVDASIMTVNEYLIARQEYKAVSVLRILRGKKENKYFAGIAVADESIHSLDDLKGKTIASRDPYSISGFILPAILFSKKDIKPKFIFTGSHEEAVKKLFDKQAQAVSTYEKIIKADRRLKLLQIMGPVPNEPFVCRKDLKEGICERLKDVLLSMPADKRGAQILLSMSDITGFEAVSPDVYADLHEMILYSGKDIYSLVPEGYKLYKINEPYYFD